MGLGNPGSQVADHAAEVVLRVLQLLACWCLLVSAGVCWCLLVSAGAGGSAGSAGDAAGASGAGGAGGAGGAAGAGWC